MKKIGLASIIVATFLYAITALAAVIPVHEYGGQPLERKVERCPASIFPRFTCDEGMVCDKCRNGSIFKYRFKRCKKGYTKKKQTCMKDCPTGFVLGNCPVANGKCDTCTDAYGKKTKFTGNCISGFGYNGSSCVANCPSTYNLTESKINKATGNYTPCTDWKNNKKRTVFKFIGCKDGYEYVSGSCQEVKLECASPKIESNGSCVCPSEYSTTKPANAKVKVCTEDNGTKKYLFNGCEEGYELVLGRCTLIYIPEPKPEPEPEPEPVEPEEKEELCNYSIYTSKNCGGDCYLCRACVDSTGRYFDLSSRTCKPGCTDNGQGVCIKNCSGVASKPVGTICMECQDARGTWYHSCNTCEDDYTMVNGSCEPIPDEPKKPSCAEGYTCGTICPQNGTCTYNNCGDSKLSSCNSGYYKSGTCSCSKCESGYTCGTTCPNNATGCSTNSCGQKKLSGCKTGYIKSGDCTCEKITCDAPKVLSGNSCVCPSDYNASASACSSSCSNCTSCSDSTGTHYKFNGCKTTPRCQYKNNTCIECDPSLYDLPSCPNGAWCDPCGHYYMFKCCYDSGSGAMFLDMNAGPTGGCFDRYDESQGPKVPLC